MLGRGKTTLATLLGIGVVAAVLRLVGLGERGLWVDEAYSALLAGWSPAHIFGALRFDSGPPLYYLLLEVWTRLFGESELALRLPSALAGIGTVVACFLTARRLGLGSGGIAAALFTSVAPILVYHAQEARYYAFLPLVCFLAILTLAGYLERPARGRWLSYVLVLTVAAYLHNYGLLLIPAAYGYAALTGRGRMPRGLHLAHATALALLIPWLPTLLAQLRFGGTAWAGAFFHPLVPLRTVEALAPGGSLPPYLGLRAVPGLRVVAAVLAVALAAISLLALRRAESRARLLPLMGFAALPGVLIYALAALGRPVYLVGRADLLFHPPLILIAATALEAMRRAWVPVAALAGAVTLSAVTLAGYYRTDVKSGDRAYVRYVDEVAGRDDIVVSTGLTYAPTVYYLRRAGSERAVVPFPVAMREHPGNLDVGAVLADPRPAIAEFTAALAGELSRTGAGSRVWLVASAGPLGRLVSAHLDSTLRVGRRSWRSGFRMGVIGAPIVVGPYDRRTEPR